MAFLHLLLLLAAVPADEADPDGRGAHLQEPRATRVGGSLSAAAAVGLAIGEGGVGPKAGFGLSLSVGLLFVDRVALSFHVEGNTLIVYTMTGAGLDLDFFLDDRWSLGGAAHAIFLFGGLHFFGLSTPLRLQFFPQPRAPRQLRREGLVLGLQLGPAFGQFLTRGFLDLAVTASFTVGYAWW